MQCSSADYIRISHEIQTVIQLEKKEKKYSCNFDSTLATQGSGNNQKNWEWDICRAVTVAVMGLYRDYVCVSRVEYILQLTVEKSGGAE